MSSHVEDIAAALKQIVSLPSDPDLDSLRPGTCLSPWSLWLLLALVRHVERQRWVGQIAAGRLEADLPAMSVAGALAHPDGPQSGLVPDATEWQYDFHGRGCCVTNRITGESIDVDFFDGSPDWIDDYFFINYLRSLKQPEFVERRLIELHPSLETVCLAFDELRELGLWQTREDSKVVTPLPEMQSLLGAINDLSEICENPGRCTTAAILLGDWPLANRSAPNVDALARESGACLEAHREQLRKLFHSGPSERFALVALCDNSTGPCSELAEALRRPASGTTSSALKIIADRPAEDWSATIFDLLCRTKPNGEIPEPHVWITCAEYLLKRGQHLDVIRSKFLQMGHRSLGEAAILALEFLPDLATTMFRRALRSTIPMDRTAAAAALAIIDQPWSRQELAAVLSESTDQEATAECRSALMMLPHPESHAVVAEWERINPHEPETGPFISMTEMALRTRDQFIGYEMEKLHDRVIKLRFNAVPTAAAAPTPKRWKWWPF